MKISIEAFLFVIAAVSSVAYAGEEAEASKELNLENFMPLCAQEIENFHHRVLEVFHAIHR